MRCTAPTRNILVHLDVRLTLTIVLSRGKRHVPLACSRPTLEEFVLSHGKPHGGGPGPQSDMVLAMQVRDPGMRTMRIVLQPYLPLDIQADRLKPHTEVLDACVDMSTRRRVCRVGMRGETISRTGLASLRNPYRHKPYALLF